MIYASWYKKKKREFQSVTKFGRGIFSSMSIRFKLPPNPREKQIIDKRRKAAATRQRRKAHQKRMGA